MDLLRSLPLGLYLEEPVTWIHKLDSRVKLAWLMSFLATPILANAFWRIGLVLLLISLTMVAKIPLRVWRQQMGWLLTLFTLVFILICITPDGLAVEYQPRLPSNELTFYQQSENSNLSSESLPWYNPFGFGRKNQTESLPQPSNYTYVLVRQGRFMITRRSLDLAIRVSTLFFALIYSTNLYLLTTAPEEITDGLETLMAPLRSFKIPVTEIVLTLTLSLRFIPLVLEEVQNLARSVSTRAINWKKLGLRKSFQIWLIVAERILANLLLRAEQIAVAMDVRGFTSPNEHRVQWNELQLRWRDWLALGSVLIFWLARLTWGNGF